MHSSRSSRRQKVHSTLAARVTVMIIVIMGVATPAAAAGGCPADFDDSGDVNFDDLLSLLSVWGPCEGCEQDLDPNGIVEFQDLLLLLAAWGSCPVGEIKAIEIAGLPLSEYPYFEYVRAFNEGNLVWVAIDPRHLDGTPTCDLYLVGAKDEAGWEADPSLTDVRGEAQEFTFDGATIQDNRVDLIGSLGVDGDAGIDLGVPYDIVCDCNQNGELDGGDYIDGLSDEAGLYVVRSTNLPGPLPVTRITYTVPNWPGRAGYGSEQTFYPADIAKRGELPLVIIGHGNGHNYQWYSHIGLHLASYGYVVMSHANDTQPGVFAASTTTLQHTDAFLAELDQIAGGALDGHIDSSHIAWIGHSRGGEGIAIAYDRIFDGLWTPVHYDLDDLRLLSSMAPTDFLSGSQTDPHSVPYHLWTAAGDSDVNGCASCNLCQTYHLHDRAREARQSITFYGSGHGDFHAGSGGRFFTGPCSIGRVNTHTIIRGYVLPLLKHYVEGNIPAKDYLTRQWERFRPTGSPNDDCVVLNMMYREQRADDTFVIDDYQSGFSSGASSSGGNVTFNVAALVENRLDDSDTTFTTNSGSMNGMTVGGTGDTSRGVVFEWEADAFYEFEIVEAERDLTDDVYVSLRACQETRHPLTTAETGDLTFTVTLRDADGVTSSIGAGAYGGGVEEPYQRTGCGTGAGWNNEFETIRIRLTDFLNNASGLDLTNIVAVRLSFGPSWGSSVGRIGIDDVEMTKD